MSKSLKDVPLDVIIDNIIGHLDYEEILNWCETNKQFRDICKEPLTWYTLAAKLGFSKGQMEFDEDKLLVYEDEIPIYANDFDIKIVMGSFI